MVLIEMSVLLCLVHPSLCLSASYHSIKAGSLLLIVIMHDVHVDDAFRCRTVIGRRVLH